jgi:NTE family protein
MALFGPKRIGLALGSGAARGLAHIGVLKVLEAEGLVPDAIAGTSMGAMVGAFWAAGIPAAEIERIARDFDVQSLLSLGDVAIGKGAVFSGARAEAFLREHLPETFEELAVPFGCVATDLARDRPVRFASGDLISAVRASISVPLAFLPVTMDGMVLVDGYVCEPVPVSLARHLGGETVVAVPVFGSGRVHVNDDGTCEEGLRIRDVRAVLKGEAPYRRGTSGLEVVGAVSEAFERRVGEQALKAADVVISPDVSAFGGFEFAQAPRLIAAGEVAARAAVRAIRRAARR